ncbi:uncharacterized protein [Bactrocera oleae]|uniref:uncharacterized protein isoform X3 n=1 Tax=Bactrocera oleae TaxID=104688 RepID=UPI00387E40AB
MYMKYVTFCRWFAVLVLLQTFMPPGADSKPMPGKKTNMALSALAGMTAGHLIGRAVAAHREKKEKLDMSEHLPPNCRKEIRTERDKQDWNKFIETKYIVCDPLPYQQPQQTQQQQMQQPKQPQQQPHQQRQQQYLQHQQQQPQQPLHPQWHPSPIASQGQPQQSVEQVHSQPSYYTPIYPKLPMAGSQQPASHAHFPYQYPSVQQQNKQSIAQQQNPVPFANHSVQQQSEKIVPQSVEIPAAPPAPTPQTTERSNPFIAFIKKIQKSLAKRIVEQAAKQASADGIKDSYLRIQQAVDQPNPPTEEQHKSPLNNSQEVANAAVAQAGLIVQPSVVGPAQPVAPAVQQVQPASVPQPNQQQPAGFQQSVVAGQPIGFVQPPQQATQPPAQEPQTVQVVQQPPQVEPSQPVQPVQTVQINVPQPNQQPPAGFQQSVEAGQPIGFVQPPQQAAQPPAQAPQIGQVVQQPQQVQPPQPVQPVQTVQIPQTVQTGPQPMQPVQVFQQAQPAQPAQGPSQVFVLSKKTGYFRKSSAEKILQTNFVLMMIMAFLLIWFQ